MNIQIIKMFMVNKKTELKILSLQNTSVCYAVFLSWLFVLVWTICV